VPGFASGTAVFSSPEAQLRKAFFAKLDENRFIISIRPGSLRRVSPA
jgi:hypothetical protein